MRPGEIALAFAQRGEPGVEPLLAVPLFLERLQLLLGLFERAVDRGQVTLACAKRLHALIEGAAGIDALAQAGEVTARARSCSSVCSSSVRWPPSWSRSPLSASICSVSWRALRRSAPPACRSRLRIAAYMAQPAIASSTTSAATMSLVRDVCIMRFL